MESHEEMKEEKTGRGKPDLNRSTTRERADVSSNRPTGDTDRIASRSREAKRLAEAVRQVADVREKKVQRLREAIESGTYKISGNDVAEKLIKESVVDSIV